MGLKGQRFSKITRELTDEDATIRGRDLTLPPTIELGGKDGNGITLSEANFLGDLGFVIVKGLDVKEDGTLRGKLMRRLMRLLLCLS